MMNIPSVMTLIFPDRVFYFARHERAWIIFKSTQAGVSTEIDAVGIIDSAWVTSWVFERAPAGSLHDLFMGRVSTHLISVSHLVHIQFTNKYY